MWQILRPETEMRDVIHRVGDADGLQQADRDQVAGFVQCFAQADGAEEGVVVVLRPPDPVHAFFNENDRRVVHQAGGIETGVQRGAVNEGLEAGAGLALGLDRPVVVALLEGEPTRQCLDRAIRGVERDQRRLGLRNLAEQGAFSLPANADDIARFDHVGGPLGNRAEAVGTEKGACPFHAFPCHRVLRSIAGHRMNPVAADLGHDGGMHAAQAAAGAQL